MGQSLIEELERTIEDGRFSDDEKASMTRALHAASASEESLRQIRNRAFELVRARMPQGDHVGLLKWLESVVRLLDVVRAPAIAVRSEAYFSPGMECLNAIVAQLRNAKKRADLCVFTISDDRITHAVLEAFQRGVAVRIVTDNDKLHDLGSDIAQIRDAGVPVVIDRTEAHMHHKFAIFDESWLLNGSYNWTRSACQYNEENLILSNDRALVGKFSAEFETLWRALSASR
jgi:mitochondrial cardiolipin hydrolase